MTKLNFVFDNCEVYTKKLTPNDRIILSDIYEHILYINNNITKSKIANSVRLEFPKSELLPIIVTDMQDGDTLYDRLLSNDLVSIEFTNDYGKIDDVIFMPWSELNFEKELGFGGNALYSTEETKQTLTIIIEKP